MAPVPAPTLDDLGIQGCLALAALLMAQHKRIPVAPTRRHSLAMLHALREQGIIEAPWPDARWELDPTAEETPIEQIQWRYAWKDYLRPGLLPALEDFLEEVPHDNYGLASRIGLWHELAASEAERFFESQLARHHFETAWASDLAFVIRDSRQQAFRWSSQQPAALRLRTFNSRLVRDSTPPPSPCAALPQSPCWCQRQAAPSQ